MNKLQQTTDKTFPIVPRLIAGGILTFFSIKHFTDPEHFRHILTAAQFPMVDLSVWAASAAELIAGLLLLSGFFTRIGGILGIATMIPAVIATLKISGLTVDTLPAGLTEVPFVPPLPLPIVTMVMSALATYFGGGKLSVDKKMSQTAPAQSIQE
ncbi:DoxX family protein [Mariniblastus sp.]|nr:DoxX family protein [Mariniblastus sp.]